MGGEGSRAAQNSENNALFVFHLPPEVDSGRLKSLFSPFARNGICEGARVVINRDTGFSSGFGFVNFTHRADAEEAIRKMNGFALANKHLKVQFKKKSHRNGDFNGNNRGSLSGPGLGGSPRRPMASGPPGQFNRFMNIK